MKGILERVRREPALLVGLVSAILVLLTAFNVALTQAQQAGIMGVIIAIGAIIVRQSVTPNVSVGAKEDTVDPGLVAGPASSVPDGEPVDVIPALGEPQDERGAYDAGSLLVAIACIVVIIAGLIFILRALT